MHRIDLLCSVGERFLRVQQGLENLVLDLHQSRGLARRGFVDRGHGRQDVADAAGLFAFGYEARPVVVDQAVPALSGHVLGGGNRFHAGVCGRLGRVDAEHFRARMGRQDHGTVQHAGPLHVIDVGLIAQGQLVAGEARQRAADAAVGAWLRDRLASTGLGHQFDGVEDLGVPGAPTQVAGQGASDLVARGVWSLVQEGLGPERNPWNAEAALQARHGDKTFRDEPTLLLGQALEGHDLFAIDLGGGQSTGGLGHAVNQHQAASALALGLAAVLGRGNAAASTQRLQKAFPGQDGHPAGLGVEGKRDLLHASIPPNATSDSSRWSPLRIAQWSDAGNRSGLGRGFDMPRGGSG